MTIIRRRPKHDPNEGDNRPFLAEEGSYETDEFEERIYDPIARSTERPEFLPRPAAQHQRQFDQQAEFEQVFEAERIARKFAPRTQEPNPHFAAQTFSARRADQGHEHDPDWHALQPSTGAFPSRRRGFWAGIATSFFIIVGIFALSGLFPSINGILRQQVSDLYNDVSDIATAGLVSRNQSSNNLDMAQGATKSANGGLSLDPQSEGTEVGSVSRAFAEAKSVPSSGTIDQRVNAQAPDLSAAQIDRLLTRGTELLRTGDIASARLLFLLAAAAGDRRGAKGVGMTYDPHVLAHLPVVGLTPDREQAELWYEQAGEDPSFIPDSDTLVDAFGTFSAVESTEPGSPKWNAACSLKYRSFDESTGMYTTYSGAQKPCQLP